VSDMIMLRPFEQERLNRLVELAQIHFDAVLTQSEAHVLMHSAAAYALPEPSAAEPRPPVRPEFLRWLMTDPGAARFIDPKGIRVWSMSIPAPLDLQGCTIPHAVHFLWDAVEAELTLFAAEVKGLFIFGGTLRKGLLADGITVHGPVSIKGAKSDGAIHLIGAEIDRNIDLSGTELTGSGIALALDGARVRGSVFMHNGFRSSGEVRMLNARVGGDLGFNGAALTATGRALSLDKVAVEGNVSLAKWSRSDGSVNVFHSDGSVNLPGAQIRGDLACDGADLAAAGISLNLATARIRGHVYLRNGFKSRGQLHMHSVDIGNSIDLSGAILTEAVAAVFLQEAAVRGTISICEGFASFGRVDVQGAQIGGNLVCDESKLSLLYCANMTLKGDLQWTGIRDPKSTSLWLNGATIKSLRDERESWPSPGGLHLDGLTYEELTLHSARTEINRQKNELGPEHPLKVKDRVEWLQLQPPSDQAEPQPWMQLAALLRTKGDDDGAKRVIFQLRRAQAKPANRVVRACKIAFARLQQQPLWVLAPIVLITSLAACLFWFGNVRGAIAPTSREAYLAWSTGSRMDAAYPRFNPLIYSLENDLPLVKFGLDDKWAPDPTYRPRDRVVSYNTLRWARVLLILCGWLQATVLAAAIGSRFKG
jgi:sRNA-binding regulator protein Hfq